MARIKAAQSAARPSVTRGPGVRLGKPRGSKYRNKKTTVDGITFDSKREANRWVELRLMEQAGEIRELVRQPCWDLDVNGVEVATYRGDFQYERHDPGGTWGTWRLVVEDVKGFKTPVYKIKARLFLALHGFRITEV